MYFNTMNEWKFRCDDQVIVKQVVCSLVFVVAVIASLVRQNGDIFGRFRFAFFLSQFDFSFTFSFVDGWTDDGKQWVSK